MKKALLLILVSVWSFASCAPTTPAIPNALTLIPAQSNDVSTEQNEIVGVSSIPSRTQMPSETSTIISTFTPTLTSTPQPVLIEHEWNADNVLILMRHSMGDGGMLLGDLGPPSFTLYANGSLFVTQSIVVGANYETKVFVKNLNREEICEHINTLDQLGYLDYAPLDYKFIGGNKPLVVGAPSTFITINAWKLRSDQYYGLSLFLQKDHVKEFYGQKGYPVISPALRNTYYFLSEYPMDGFKVYEPDRLAVWMLPVEGALLEGFPEPQKWDMNNVSLIDLMKMGKSLSDGDKEKFIILNGEEAKSIYAYMDNVIDLNIFFIEDLQESSKKYYAVFARPLLPYEMPGEFYMSELPVSGSPKPNTKLACYPTDGVISIPTPHNQ